MKSSRKNKVNHLLIEVYGNVYNMQSDEINHLHFIHQSPHRKSTVPLKCKAMTGACIQKPFLARIIYILFLKQYADDITKWISSLECITTTTYWSACCINIKAPSFPRGHNVVTSQATSLKINLFDLCTNFVGRLSCHNFIYQGIGNIFNAILGSRQEIQCKQLFNWFQLTACCVDIMW